MAKKHPYTRLPFRKKASIKVFRKYKDVQTKLHDLTYLFWECTLRCNINCLHCGSDCHKDQGFKDMPCDDFINVLKQLREKQNPNKTMIVITGGEPLVRSDLTECGRKIYELGYPWGMVTNGYILDEKRFNELMKSGLRSITLSFDGFEENHNWLRGRNDSFQRAERALNLIAGAGKGLVYDTVTCVNKRNISELPYLKDYLIKKGVERWRLFTIFPIGRAKENPELALSPQEFLEVMKFLKKTRKEGKIRAAYGCEGYLGNFENEVRDGFFFCRAGINIGGIMADGSIAACPNIHPGFSQGNIYEDDFIEVWENRYEPFRNREWNKKGICENCKEYVFCQGNGMHLHDPDDPEVLRCHLDLIKQAEAIGD